MIPEVQELEKLREKLSYSQADVARILDVSESSYQNWVYKEHEPTYQNLKKINKGREILEERATNKRGQKVPTKEELKKRKEENSDKVKVVDYGSRR